jgi:hypothetical protein
MNFNYGYKNFSRGFFKFNIKRQMSMLNTINKDKKSSICLLNRVYKKNFSQIVYSSIFRMSVAFRIFGGAMTDAKKLNADFIALLQDEMKFNEAILNNGSLMRVVQEQSLTLGSLRRTGIDDIYT